MQRFKRTRGKRPFILIGISTGIVVIGLLLLFVRQQYTVKTVLVEGNVHYSDEEIQEMVMNGFLGDNSLYLFLKYKNKAIKDIPFIERMDVSVMSNDTVKITVYEKALAGYIEYLNRYMYFDKDGIIVESSTMKTGSIPQVTGLEFGYVVLYEKLPVENEEIFKQILNITQLLTKYDLLADKIYFNSSYEMVLYFGEAKVMMGTNESLDEKILQLKGMMPHIEGKSGTVHLENFSEGTKTISMELD